MLRKRIKLGGPAGIAIDPRVVYVAGLPMDRAGCCLLAQPLTTHTAMGLSNCIVFLHNRYPPFIAALAGPVTVL